MRTEHLYFGVAPKLVVYLSEGLNHFIGSIFKRRSDLLSWIERPVQKA